MSFNSFLDTWRVTLGIALGFILRVLYELLWGADRCCIIV